MPEDGVKPNPSVFISHRHADREIANVIREWINDSTMGVTVYQSTHVRDSTRTGDRLAEVLRHQLHDSAVILCPFTGHGPDWSWCMWECGLATDPLAESTRVVILQFSDDFPGPYGDLVRVDARDDGDVVKFATDFLTDPQYFPGHDQALRSDLVPGDPLLQRKASELFKALRRAGPPGPRETWESWSVLILEFPMDLVDSLDDEQPEPERIERIKQMLMEDCEIVDAQRLARNIFGIIKFPERMAFEKLYSQWKRQYPESRSGWFDSVARQISLTARRQLPATDWELVEGATSQLTIPVLCWTVRDPAKASFQFHIYFIPVKRLDPATGRLVELGFVSDQGSGGRTPSQ